VNWAHLETFAWLRWRLLANQSRRSGPWGPVLSTIVTVMMATGGVLALLIGFVVGLVPLSQPPHMAKLVIWDAVVVGFVFFWTVGLMAELQRSESLSLDRFLHLPVTPSGAFLINYVGSSLSLSVVLFLPAMIGLSAGLVLSAGPVMLVLFPLVAAFFLMVTGVTYQFRGWLASMMANPRRRRTIVAVMTVAFILVFQIPNLLNNFRPEAREERQGRTEARRVRESGDTDEVVRQVNRVVPFGWLPYGAYAAANGSAWPALAGTLGMGLIGAISLRRAYRTTIRLYTGDFDRGRRSMEAAGPAVVPDPARTRGDPAALLERRLPWISERASAVALAGFRSLARAPEVKMMLLTPVIMVVLFGGTLAGREPVQSEYLRALTASGLAAFILIIAMVGFVANQFGFDRRGFRAFVLSPIPRRDVLLGKNLSLAPFAFAPMAVVIGVSQWLSPMRLDHLVAVLVQMVPVYLLFCLGGNLLTIFAPMAVKPGSGMPGRHQGLRLVYQLLFMAVVPLPLGLTLIPLGLEALLDAIGWLAWFPAFLVLGTAQAAATVWLYGLALDWQGGLLYRREQDILEVVGSRAE
jgi:ABC-2 type transport system permease protein